MKKSYLIWLVIAIAIIIGGYFIWTNYATQTPVAYNQNANGAGSLPTGTSPSINPTNTPVSTTPQGSVNAPATAPIVGLINLHLVTDAKLGDHLAAIDGMTLYYFTKDSANTDTCTGDCATVWPPYIVLADTKPTADPKVNGKIGTIKLADGSMQLTYNGAPLYKYSKDSTPLETKGQGVGGVWFVAKP
jgi:predicted lipoprotein with Yx(FWY)xxD motif